ncbi:hypothetical protein GCM10022408_37780 [Hymenobacter fastidiosus]|uniref:Uncharacterized protein n=1 Tax=Hymenobacter fastidiosus TaxID=486264 RepID=A0ABP7T2T6_9BACT
MESSLEIQRSTFHIDEAFDNSLNVFKVELIASYPNNHFAPYWHTGSIHSKLENPEINGRLKLLLVDNRSPVEQQHIAAFVDIVKSHPFLGVAQE